jgi:hypothetical protein
MYIERLCSGTRRSRTSKKRSGSSAKAGRYGSIATTSQTCFVGSQSKRVPLLRLSGATLAADLIMSRAHYSQWSLGTGVPWLTMARTTGRTYRAGVRKTGTQSPGAVGRRPRIATVLPRMHTNWPAAFGTLRTGMVRSPATDLLLINTDTAAAFLIDQTTGIIAIRHTDTVAVGPTRGTEAFKVSCRARGDACLAPRAHIIAKTAVRRCANCLAAPTLTVGWAGGAAVRTAELVWTALFALVTAIIVVVDVMAHTMTASFKLRIATMSATSAVRGIIK